MDKELEIRIVTSAEKKEAGPEIPEKINRRNIEHINTLNRQMTATLQAIAKLAISAKKDESSPILEPLPQKAVEIETQLKRLDVNKQQLVAEKASYLKLATQGVEDLKSVDAHSINDLSKINSLVAKAQQVFATLSRLEKEHETCVNQFNDFADAFFQTSLHEAGFSSNGEIGSKLSELQQQLWSLQGKLFGSFRFRDQISKLEKEIERLEVVQKTQFANTKYYSGHAYEEEKLLDQTGEAAVGKTHKVAKIIEKDIGELNAEGMTVALQDELNAQYMDTVRKELATEIRQRRSEGKDVSVRVSGIGTKAQRERALALIQESLGIAMNAGRKWYPSPEEQATEEQKNRLNAEVNDLPWSLREVIRGHIVRSGSGNDIWKDFSNRVVHWPKEQWHQNYKEGLEVLAGNVKGVNQSLWNFKQKITDISRELAGEMQGGVEKRLPVSEFDWERWKLFRGNDQVKRTYGEDALLQCERVVQAEILDQFKVSKKDEEWFPLGVRLMKLKNAEAAPQLLLTAFRKTAHGGHHPFIHPDTEAKETQLYQYIVSLSAEDTAVLQARKIPGLMELVEIVKTDSTFNKPHFLVKKEDDTEWQDNPRYGEINTHLNNISSYLLEQGTLEDKNFAIDTLTDSTVPMATQAVALGKILKGRSKDSSFELKETLSEVLLSRFKWRKDSSALFILVEGVEHDKTLLYQFVKTMAFDWSRFSDQNCTIKPEDLQELRQRMEPLLSSEIQSEKAYERFPAFVAAKNLGLPLKPSADDMVSFFEEQKSLADGVSSTPFCMALAEDTTFTDEQRKKVATAFIKNTSAHDLRSEYAEKQNTFLILLDAAELNKEHLRSLIGWLVFSWEKISGTLEPETLDELRRRIEPLLSFEIKSEIPSERFSAFIAAKNIELPFRPSADDIVNFFETGLSGYSSLIALAKDVELTDAHRKRIAAVYVKELIKHQSSNAGVTAFIESWPAGENFTEANKSMIVTLHALRSPEELIETMVITSGSGNWQTQLSAYILSENGQLQIRDKFREKIHDMFDNTHQENRDFCLNALQQEFRAYLSSESATLPLGALPVVESIKRSEGAGDLKYIEGLGQFMAKLEDVFSASKTVTRTKQEIRHGLQRQEECFNKERWSEDDKTAFYNISQNILIAAPSLYTDFLDLFQQMNGKELKSFAREYYPLYQANLVMLEKPDKTFNPRELVPLRKGLETLAESFGGKAEEKVAVFEKGKRTLVDTLSATCKRRFGLLKLPETITDEGTRYIQNCTRYLANVKRRDETKELLITFYLGLNLNGEWLDFRAGKPINAADYFEGKKLEMLTRILEDRKEKNVLSPDVLGIESEQISKFQEALQSETISNMIGNVQTIDIKLGNAKRSMQDLADPDLYPDKTEKEALEMSKKNGKAIGVTLAKVYQVASGKRSILSPEEQSIAERLKEIFVVGEWTAKNVKEVQDKMQLPNLVCGMVRKLDEEKIDEEIDKLQKLLKPTDEIIAIFNSLGEEFMPTSGALALSQDLSYLENIIIKDEQKISPEQKPILEKYLQSIRAQMVALETLSVKVIDYFEKIKKSTHQTATQLFKNRLDEIGEVLYQKNDAVALTSTVTSNLNTIIENMRQCLGCLREEINNDTNLTFGDSNKFYIVSHGDTAKKSIADEIAFFAPISTEEGNEMSFVLDQVWGSKSSDVLLAHIKAMAKKCMGLKKSFPKSKLSVFVTNAALQSVGLSSFQAAEKIKEAVENMHIEILEEVTIAIGKSALGDNYIEFGNTKDIDARTSGDRVVSGLHLT